MTRSPNSWPPPTTPRRNRPGFAESAAGCIVAFSLAALALVATLGAIVLIRWVL